MEVFNSRPAQEESELLGSKFGIATGRLGSTLAKSL